MPRESLIADAGTTTADAADRLEAALERIARRAAPGQAPAPSDLPARLDLLIAELRSVLGRDSAE